MSYSYEIYPYKIHPPMQNSSFISRKVSSYKFIGTKNEKPYYYQEILLSSSLTSFHLIDRVAGCMPLCLHNIADVQV